MPSKRFDQMRAAARYAPVLSLPVLECIAEIEQGLDQHDLARAVKKAVRGAVTRSDLGALYGDLICALNCSDALPLVAGLMMAHLLESPQETP